MDSLVLSLQLIPVGSIDSWNVPWALSVPQISLIAPFLLTLSQTKVALVMAVLVMVVSANLGPSLEENSVIGPVLILDECLLLLLQGVLEVDGGDVAEQSQDCQRVD